MQGHHVSSAQVDIIFELRVKRLMTADEIAPLIGVQRKAVDRKLALWPEYGPEWLAAAKAKRARELALKAQAATMGSK